MYEINSKTLAVIPYEENLSRVIEVNNEFKIEDSVSKIIDENCKYYGSSYNGRLSGTKKILGISYKAPIIIEESDDMIFIPTASPRFNSCIWIALKNIKNYEKFGKKVSIIFMNDTVLNVDMSYSSFDNQVLRAARLQMLFKNRKINLKS